MSSPSIDSITVLPGNSLAITYTIGSGTLSSIKLLVNKVLTDSKIQHYDLSKSSGVYNSPLSPDPLALLNNIQHSFRLQQINTDGSVFYSNTELAIPQDVPLAPLISEVSTGLYEGDSAIAFKLETYALQGDALKSLTFPVYSGSNANTGDSVTWSASGPQTQGNITVKPIPNTTSYIVALTGLTNSVTYEIECQSINKYGVSPSSNVVYKAPVDVENHIETVLATPQDKSIKLFIKMFPVPWYDEITSFLIRTNQNAVPDEVFIGQLTPETGEYSYSFVVTGLTNGEAYTAGIATKLKYGGTSPEYTNANMVYAFANPGVPTNFKAVADDTLANLTWDAPDLGGMELDRYDISTPDDDIVGTSMTTSYSATGLLNGTPVTFKVRAVTLDKNVPTGKLVGLYSIDKSCTPFGKPGAPKDLDVVVSTYLDQNLSKTRVTIDWEPPDVTGGFLITKYNYKISKNGIVVNSGFVSTTSLILDDQLSIGMYSVSVQAVTLDLNTPSTGDVLGDFSSPVEFSTFVQPDAISNFKVTASNGIMRASWTPLTDNYGGDILAYEVMWGTATGVYPNSQFVYGQSSSLDLFFPKFTLGTPTMFNIQAIMSNPNGGDSVSGLQTTEDAETPFVQPAAVSNFKVTAIPSSQIMRASWTPLTDNYGGDILAYEVMWGTATGVYPNSTQVYGQTKSSVDLPYSSFTLGTPTMFNIHAIMSNPNGGDSVSGLQTTEDAEIPFLNLDKPTELEATPGDMQVALKWKAPSSGGFAIEYYNVYVDDVYRGNTPDATTTYNVSSLTNGQSHRFRVRAVFYDLNKSSEQDTEGEQSDEVSKIPRRALAAVQLTVTPNDRGLLVSYTAPADIGVGKSGSTVARYWVEVKSLAPFGNTNISYTNTIDNGINTSLNISFTAQYPLWNDYAYLATVWAESTDPNGGVITEVNKTSLTSVPNGDPIMVGLVTADSGKSLLLTVKPNGSNIDEVYAIVTDGVDGHPDYVLSLKDIVNQSPDEVPNENGLVTKSILISTTSALISASSFPPDSTIVGAYVIASNSHGMSMITLGTPPVIYNTN